MGWLLSSNVDLEEKTVTKSVVLFDEDDLISGPFIILGTDSLSLSRI